MININFEIDQQGNGKLSDAFDFLFDFTFLAFVGKIGRLESSCTDSCSFNA